MKNFLLISIFVISIFVSCKKEAKETNEKNCPVVAANLVPSAVKDSFMNRYPMDSVKTWFNKDSVGYCAYFVSSGIEKLVQFSNNGNFIKEEIETDHESDHEDSTTTSGKQNGGCECEVHGHND